jgi:NDP-sugar pyrophosphorylase family protein
MSKRAVILAGGKGTRLKPYTVALPKPLVPIGEYPILEIIIRQLAFYGFDHVTITVNHLADIIKAFFGDGSKWNIKIDYSLEDKPLSTMGPLKLIKDLPENFLIMNGDVLTDLNYAEFYDDHVSSGNIFTISSYQREEAIEYGILESDSENKLCAFKEKPKYKYSVSMGIYMANKAILQIIPDNQFYGFDHLMLELLKNNDPASIRNFDGYWMDIGRPDDYMQAVEEFQMMNGKLLK